MIAGAHNREAIAYPAGKHLVRVFILTLHPLEFHHFCLQENMLLWCLGYKHISPNKETLYTHQEKDKA